MPLLLAPENSRKSRFSHMQNRACGSQAPHAVKRLSALSLRHLLVEGLWVPMWQPSTLL